MLFQIFLSVKRTSVRYQLGELKLALQYPCKVLNKSFGCTDIFFHQSKRFVAGAHTRLFVVEQSAQMRVAFILIVDDEPASAARKLDGLLRVSVLRSVQHRQAIHSRL